MKKRSVLLSVLTLMLCLSLVAGGTYALFSDQVVLRNHLQAGTLDLELWRIDLVTKSLDNTTGFLVDTHNEKDIDFSDPADLNDTNAENRNVFDIVDDTLIVPGCSYTATMEIRNNTDVAYGYWLEIVFDKTADPTLTEQLKITVQTADATKSITGMLNVTNGLLGDEGSPIEIIAKTKTAQFIVTVEFCNLDHAVNNTAKLKDLDFDIIVHAVQVTKAP